MLEYKAKWYGREIIIAPQNYASSQLCSECGYKNVEVKNLALREWKCPNCGTIHDRDVNASKNLLKLAMQMVSLGKEQPFERGETCSDWSIDHEATTSIGGGSSLTEC